jgi:putative ABC transport system permease protein
VNLVSISLRNLKIRALSSTLTVVSIVLGTALLCGIWLLIDAADRHFRGGQLGYTAIVGPKQGSALELVLNTVFNRGVSPGLVPFSVYEQLHEEKLQYRDRKLPMRYVIPQARGDNYKGFPIIGTTDEMFSKFKRGEHGTLEFAQGQPFAFGHVDLLAFLPKLVEHLKEKHEHGKEGEKEHDHEHGHPEGAHEHGPHGEMVVPKELRKAVIGARVARELGLSLGSPIVATHGLSDEAGAHVHEESKCEVVGILAATGSAIDEALYVPLATFLAISEHQDLKEGQSADASGIGLSAIIVEPAARGIGASYLRDAFQMRPDAQAAFTGGEVTRLLEIVGNVGDALRVVADLVLLVAALSILVALYNTMNERRREIAIMRSLGARRGQILRIILFEGVLISCVGACLGVLACHLAAWAGGATVERMARFRVEWAVFSIAELWLILGVTALGGFAGVLPAWKGSRTQVAENLGPTS